MRILLSAGAIVCAIGGWAADASAAKEVFPYGVCAHVTRSERDAHRLKGTLDSMELAGIRYVRSDFDSWAVKKKDGSWDFAGYDTLLDALDARGVTLLPILYATENPPKDLAAYRQYVRTVVGRYGRRLPVWEIWNEANLESFFRGADPLAYAELLKTAYAAIKSVDPSIRVAYTGTAGVPLGWIRKTFEAGVTNAFDVMNIHPYSHPSRPEGSVDVKIEKLRALMAEFGIADKPLWITEVGWPTHTLTICHANILLAGLKVARPGQKRWKMILASVASDGPEPDQSLAKTLEFLLPPGSEVVCCTQAETVRRLAKGGVDAVVYPFDESFPVDTTKAVNDFVRDGGVLVDFGGMPCYYARRNDATVAGSSIADFPFGSKAWWTDKSGACPRETRVFATSRGAAAGVRQEPTGFKALRFLTPERIGRESQWLPLVSGKDKTGGELVAAAVVRYAGARKGAAVLSSLFPYGAAGTNDEENQALYIARTLGLVFAEGVEACFPYNLRSFEKDPYYSEHHFGLMHADFTPKPAYSAYATFTRERPSGSVGLPGAWHDAARRHYFPQWTRPDGVKGGMVWTLEKPAMRTLRFAGKPVFRNVYGRKIGVQDLGEGRYRLSLGGSPVYFSGAVLQVFEQAPRAVRD